jgi:hypothetical protein
MYACVLSLGTCNSTVQYGTEESERRKKNEERRKRWKVEGGSVDLLI